MKKATPSSPALTSFPQTATTTTQPRPNHAGLFAQSAQPANLCELCEKKDFFAPLSSFHEDLGTRDLWTAVSPNCFMCDLLISQLRNGVPNRTNPVSRRPGIVRLSIWLLRSELDPGYLDPESVELTAHWQGPATAPGYTVLRATICVGDFPKVVERDWEPIPSLINPGQVRSWLDECVARERRLRHTQDMNYSVFAAKDGFRLIDCTQKCLTTVKSHCDFVALSYVWGSETASRLTTKRHNLEQLGRPESLVAILPRTIEDAVSLCLRMGFRYLWVDGFCIVQDDNMERDQLVNQMSRIYDAAVVTIIAHACRHADEPIPGISQARDHNLNKVAFITSEQGCVYLSIPRPYSVPGNTWEQRGWTYQEQLFSRRSLYMTSKQLIFHGEIGWRSEVPITEFDPPHQWQNLEDINEDWGVGSYPAFRKTAGEYTHKTLTFPGDILRAYTGIYNYISNPESHEPLIDIATTRGIPQNCWPGGLLWVGTSHSDRLRSELPERMLPSWSWLRVNGSRWPMSESYYSLVEHFDIGRPSQVGLVSPCRVPGQSYLALPDTKLPSAPGLEGQSSSARELTPCPPSQLRDGELGFWAPYTAFRRDMCERLKVEIEHEEIMYMRTVGKSSLGTAKAFLHMDDEKLRGDFIEVVFLAVEATSTSVKKFPESRVYGLVVGTDSGGIAERLGVIEFYPPEQGCMMDFSQSLEGWSGYEWRYIRLR